MNKFNLLSSSRSFYVDERNIDFKFQIMIIVGDGRKERPTITYLVIFFYCLRTHSDVFLFAHPRQYVGNFNIISKRDY